MQRRTFIGSVLAGLAATSLPLAAIEAPAPALQVWNTATLTASLEKMFACQLGPAMALFETNKDGDIIEVKKEEKPHPQFPNQMETVYEETAGNKRYIYSTYACAIEGGTAEEAEARLAKHFYDEFSKLPAGALIWRVRPQFKSYEAIKWGEVWASKEYVEDQIHVRLGRVIPPNVELDLNDGKYKYVLGKVQVHKMRMRLVMPHLYASPAEDKYPLPHLLKVEGAMINRMV